MGERSKAPSGDESRYQSKLDLFVREFESEAKLRAVLDELFRRMGHTGVRITHGSNEKGKDLVFHAIGPLGERRLFACVVKNAPITGRADDPRLGAPSIVRQLDAVINQIQSAFSEPLSDTRGSDEWVDTVYVISPYPCNTTTIDSVKHLLRRSGQISFICGQALLELLAEHWPEFLWFESSVLLAYLSALRKGLQQDYALATLILRKAHLEQAPGEIADLYVQPTFFRTLQTFRFVKTSVLDPALLKERVAYHAIQREIRRINEVSETLRTAPTREANSDAISAADEVIRIGRIFEELWEDGYRRHVATIQEEARRTHRASSAGRRYPIAVAAAPPRHQVGVVLQAALELEADVADVAKRTSDALGRLQTCSDDASHFACVPPRDPAEALGSAAFLTYCQVSETAKTVPCAFDPPVEVGTLTLEEDLLDRFPGSLLITGPAGFGKTMFCRWHAIADANRLVDKDARVLPVYTPLYPLSVGNLASFEEVFFRSDELRKLVRLKPSSQSPFDRIRLYLDGLDEVTSTERQAELMRMSAEAVAKYPFLQVIVTGRDHVTGPSLRWLPRIRLSPLNDHKIRQLAERWLPPERVDEFFVRMNDVGNLTGLMAIPLLATLILAVYRKTGTVPPNRTNLYSTFVELLSGGWDFYKQVQRRENQFSVNDKTAVLTQLASALHLMKKRDATTGDFRSAVKNTLPSFVDERERMLQEVLEDGLLVTVGRNTTFSHLSFQEYLAARGLQDPMRNRPQTAISRYFRGDDWWREVLGFYVTITDRPAEMDEWIARRALASGTTAVDLVQRVAYLRKSLMAAFPAYQEGAGAKRLHEELLLKTDKASVDDDVRGLRQ